MQLGTICRSMWQIGSFSKKFIFNMQKLCSVQYSHTTFVKLLNAAYALWNGLFLECLPLLQTGLCEIGYTCLSHYLD